MRKKRFILPVVIIAVLMLCVTAHAFKLPDTGQTTCYDSAGSPISCSGTGQDGAYVKARSYSDGGTVIDNVTGLEWQKCSAGQKYNTNDKSCSLGTAARYNWYQASGTHDDTYNPDGYSVCGSIGSDWRLPSYLELQTLQKFSVRVPGPTIDTAYFPNTLGDYYWTDTTSASNPILAWYVSFYDGQAFAYYKYSNMYVRCVRGGQIEPAPRYTDNLDGTVTDKSTGLMWQQGEAGGKIWSDALSYCNDLSLAGNSDWRLPDVLELRSLADTKRALPAINADYFPDAISTFYWASTTCVSYENCQDDAWHVSFADGATYRTGKEGTIYVRCVRGALLLSITAKANGTGAGAITSSPAGISYKYPAANTKTAPFEKNSTIKLTAKGTGSNVSWGSTCAAANGTVAGNGTATATCTLKVSKAATLTATFTQLYSTITANATGAGAGSVSSTPSGISYAYPAANTDSGSYKNASKLTLTAKAKTGSKATWNGACTAAGGTETGNNTLTATCILTVNKDATVTVTFTK
jgi:hypothetical protein